VQGGGRTRGTAATQMASLGTLEWSLRLRVLWYLTSFYTECLRGGALWWNPGTDALHGGL